MKNQKIVNLRALAILIVVFGHSIIIYSSDWNLYQTNVQCPILDFMKKIIDFFQMQLFFSLSGYLFFFSQRKERKVSTFLFEKTKRLLIPFCAISALWMIPIRMLVGYSGYSNMTFFEIYFSKVIYGKDNGHLWFLPTLFLIFSIMYFICKILYKKDLPLFYIISGIFLLIISLASKKIYIHSYANNVMRYLIWFYVGFVINRYEKELTIYKKILSTSAFLSLMLGITLEIFYASFLSEYLISGCLVFIAYLLMPCISNNLTSNIDRNSFGIYLFHSPLIYITFATMPNAHPLIIILINFILFGILAYIMTITVRKLKLYFILGE
ncbi:MAG: acyltransferase [Lachnospiraceae bacterium]|nr:acyltransferase [Lachnospiraceae bacterium]